MITINMNRSIINNTGLNENNCLNNLLDNVSYEFDNEFNIISHSKYCNDVDFKEILQETNLDICILNLNFLNRKTLLDKLKIFLADSDSHSKISCITLQCTCFDEYTDLIFPSIPGYTLISDAYRISSHCGVAISLNTDFSYERKFINNTSAVFESMAIEIWKNYTVTIASKYLISSVYRPPSVLVDTLTSFIG